MSGTNISHGRKLFLLIVTCPLLFAVTGVWQLRRSHDPGIPRMRAEYAATVAAIEAAQKEAGNPDIRLRINNNVVTASAFLRHVQAERNNFEAYAFITRVSFGIAGLEALFGLLASVIGGAGLFGIRRMGARAINSREDLLSLFSQGARRLPWLIGSTGFPMATALALGLAYEALNFAARGIDSRADAKLLIIGALLILALLYYAFKLIRNIFSASRAVFERDSMLLMGKRVARKEAPLVWAFVDSVACGAGAAMPDNIILGLDKGFFVTEHPVTLLSGAPAPKGRILYLPLPYMAFMTNQEAAAVIGHELGHFTGADTEYSLRFTPIYAGAVNNLRAVVAATDDTAGIMGIISRPAVLLGEFFLDSFDLAVRHWSREREFAADQTGASVAGNEAVASSLLRVSVLAPHVDQALAECWAEGGRLEGGVLNRVRELVAEYGLGNPEDHLEETQPHPTDSHPTMRQRLEAVSVPISPELLRKAGNTAESGLLRELGIEAGPTPQSVAAPPDEDGAPPPGLPATGRIKDKEDHSAALEAEFSRMARKSIMEETEQLKELASRGKEKKAFYEGGILLLGLWGLLILVCIMVAVVMPDPRFRYGAVTAGLFLAGCLGLRIQRRRKPFVIFTFTGLLFADLAEPVPWTAVHKYAITMHSTNGMTTSVNLEIDLADGYTPPVFTGDRRVKYRAGRHVLAFSVMNLRGRMNADTFSREFTTYWQAGVARAQLAAMRNS